MPVILDATGALLTAASSPNSSFGSVMLSISNSGQSFANDGCSSFEIEDLG